MPECLCSSSCNRGTFLIFSLACFAGYLWSTYLVPETANVSLEEIDAVFGSNAGLEELELKSQVSPAFREMIWWTV